MPFNVAFHATTRRDLLRDRSPLLKISVSLSVVRSLTDASHQSHCYQRRCISGGRVEERGTLSGNDSAAIYKAVGSSLTLVRCSSLCSFLVARRSSTVLLLLTFSFSPAPFRSVSGLSSFSTRIIDTRLGSSRPPWYAIHRRPWG